MSGKEKIKNLITTDLDPKVAKALGIDYWLFDFIYVIYIQNMPTTTISKKLTPQIKTFILRAIHEILSDPDFGLELSEKAKKRLRQAASSKQKTISFSEIKKKYY